MRTKILAISVLVILAFSTMIFMSNVFADIGEGDWITKYRVENSETGQVIMDKDFTTGASNEYSSIVEGADLQVTVTVEIGISNPAATLQLSTEMSHSTTEDRYWQLVSQEFDLVNYNPNSKSIQFKQTAGTLEMICYGSIPTGIVRDTVDGLTLHKPVPIALIELAVPGGAVLDNIEPNVTDAKVDEYLNLLDQKETKLAGFAGSGVDPGYVEVYGNVVAQAKIMGDAGFADNAIALLNGLDVANEPASSLLQMLFLPAMIVFGVVAVLFAFLFLRARGKMSYFRLVIEDQIKDLEGLTLRVSKIDRTISSNLSGIEDRLKRLVGM